ncbi:MAG: hypothetical protein Q8P53_01175 [Candidatus Shapirobacteria bacterium]|nr:hypothetical protein [Candidatus Shapirobacteria bacterium]
MKTKILVLLSFAFLFFLFKKNILAQSFSSSSYKIQWGNFNMTAGKKTSSSYQLTDTVGQNAPGKFNNTGYILKSGFQYIYDTFFYFSFQIDDLSLDFGSLVPGIGTTQTNIITISAPSGNGYQIMAVENHPLRQSSGTTIPDTKCNSDSCNKTTSAVWDSSTAYGFGFNAIGINSSGAVTNIGTSNYFTDSTYFRPFANATNTPIDAPQIIMSENSPIKNRSAKVTYKINISAIQSAGNYQNGINFIAVPKY